MDCGQKPVRYCFPRTVQQMTRFNSMGRDPYTEFRIFPKNPHGPDQLGIQFGEQSRNRKTPYSQSMRFDMVCTTNETKHRRTEPNHPSTKGHVARMNHTVKQATVKRYHNNNNNHDQLLRHLCDFLNVYYCARRLKTLSGLTPKQYICKTWTSEPDRFILNPINQMSELTTQAS